MRLSKIGKVVKEARQCVLCNTRERTGQEANLIQQWIGAGEAMYPVDENVRLTERARRRLALLMDANFGRNDLHVTLTYRGTPPDYEQARKDVRNYLRAVKRMREKAGLPEMKYIYVIEEEGGDGERRRIHVHLMMTGGVSREALEEKWGRGYANCDRLQPEEGNELMELARYFTKLEQEKHRRAWSASQKRPCATAGTRRGRKYKGI